MRSRFLGVIICIAVYVVPVSSVSAQELVSTEALLQQIVVLLQKQVALLSEKRVSSLGPTVLGATYVPRPVPPVHPLLTSQFYSGAYKAVYVANGSTISLVTGQESRVYLDIWKQFVMLGGEAFIRDHVAEFRVYSDARASFDAFTEKDSRTGEWIVGVNAYDLKILGSPTWKELDQLLVHEIGHIVLGEHPEVIADYDLRFTSAEDRIHYNEVGGERNEVLRDDLMMEYYSTHDDAYVSEYATMSALEDIVESFTYYVLHPLPLKSSQRERDQKVSFFEEHGFFSAFRAQ